MPNRSAEHALRRLRDRLADPASRARDLARKAKISEVTLSKWKKGSLVFDPRLSTLDRLAYGLDVTAAELISDAGVPIAPEKRPALEAGEAVLRIVEEIQKRKRAQ